MKISEVQRLAWKNKISKGLSGSANPDVPYEFALAYGELAEAFDAWRKNPAELPGELADVVIYIACIAEMTGIDLDMEVQNKIAINAIRNYLTGPTGALTREV